MIHTANAAEPAKGAAVIVTGGMDRPEIIAVDNRLLGAIAIAGAGALFGFAGGRISAWLVPAGTPVAAQYGSESKPSIPLEPAAPKQAAAPVEPPKSPPAPQLQPPADTGLQKAEVRAPGVTSRALSPPEQTAKTEPTATPELKVINPGGAPQVQRGKGRLPSSAVPDTDEGATPMLIGQGGEDGIERCRAKYRSFDPVDGTYKPYGQDTRVRCPHLR